MRSMLSVALLGLWTVILTAPAQAENGVRVDGGLVSGTTNGSIRIFQGIPFAVPPVGELRWRMPQSPTPWQGVRKSESFSPACMQDPRRANSVYFNGAEQTSEDCLYLNV
jgi:para-nitrobenzyl esterase